jgi:hypothetical protein
MSLIMRGFMLEKPLALISFQSLASLNVVAAICEYVEENVKKEDGHAEGESDGG